MILINRSRSRYAAPVEAVRRAQRSQNPFEVKARSRRRSGDLLGAIQRLDVATTDEDRRELLEFITGLYEQHGGIPVGLFAKCWLGAPYLDHIVSFEGEVVRHFKETETVPEEYAMARPLARNDAYAFIEVYSDGAVIPIRNDGSAVI